MNRVNQLDLCWYDDGRGNLHLARNDRPFTGVSVRYRDDGSVYDEKTYYNGIAHGLYIAYHPNGRVQSRGHLSLGVSDGEWTHWYESGLVERVEMMATGELLSRKTYGERGELLTDELHNQGEAAQRRIAISKEIHANILAKDLSEWHDDAI